MQVLTLDSPPSRLPKIKAADVQRLTRLGITSIRDLLLALPFGWETYGDPIPIAELRDGAHATVIGTLTGITAKRTPRRNLKLAEATLKDDAGSAMKVVWFHQPYLAAKLAIGQRIAVAGIVKASRFGGAVEMRNPYLEELATPGGTRSNGPSKIRGLMPKYHLTTGLTSPRMSGWIEAALPLAGGIEDVLPEAVRARHRLLPIAEAVRAGHRPDDVAQWEQARDRMAWAELFEYQVAALKQRLTLERLRAVPVPYRQDVIDAFKAGLGFELTYAQKRSAWEIFKDMAREQPMNRLLNGEVGSGKTAVAAAAVAMAYAAGVQSMVMAPTEILARQHLQKFRAHLEGSFPGLTVELLVSGISAPERRRVRTAAASGHCALLVGTHALIEEEVELAALGLAVVDEQHRFGTRQRELLRAKGSPHFLAMTATPIPRTLAMARYGDMGVSVIDQMPPGRMPVRTEIIVPSDRERAYQLVRDEVGSGHQAFVICPLIDESEKLEAKAATAEFERLRTQVFPELRVALVHGRLREKDAIMRAFRDGESDVLVATPVIEVGVDIPGATVMLVEGAEHFGLAQLHQFRGRVGRGALQSYCLLLADDPAGGSLERLELLAHLHDGFRLAEADMRLRGPGQLMGTRQHGISDAAMQALFKPELLSELRLEAETVLTEDPDLELHPALRQAVEGRLALTSIT